MMEEPVEKRSDRRTKRNCAVDQITSSSARRLRWTAQMPAADRNSSAKSRSETASSELAMGRSKPSSRAVMSRSMGKEVPASAAAPRGDSFIRAARRQSARGRGESIST
jgi:hypothetical protein